MTQEAPRTSHLPAVALALALALAGCAGNAGQVLEKDRLAQVLRSRGLDPSAIVVPFELNDEMRAWAHETASEELTPEARLRRLRARLLDDRELSVEYIWGYTGTAIEVFEERQANCLSFTNLFVGMAREVGVPVCYLAVENVETYRKEGDLVVVSDHIAAGYDVAPGALVFDFSQHGVPDDGQVRRISDLTALAMFYTNRSAEALQAGDVEESLRWSRTAVLLDPELANAWVNLGVGLRRSGDPRGAEDAYKKSLEVDPRAASAYQNLTSLLTSEGRLEEAREYELTLQRSPSKNPYTYLSLGDISRRNGRFAEARRLYRRAIHLGCEVAECYAAFGQLALAEGEVKTARRMLRKARKLDSENSRTQQLDSQLRSGPGRKS